MYVSPSCQIQLPSVATAYVAFHSNCNSTNPRRTDTFHWQQFYLYWNIPHMVEEMAAHYKLQWDVDQVTLGGATLAQHWEGERGLNTRTVLG